MGFSATNILVLFCCLVCFGSTPEVDKDVTTTYVKEGEDVVLHCSSGNSENLEHSVVEWKNKDGNEAFLYEHGRHTEDGWCCQDEQYRGRASLFYDELKNGNASMILRDARVEDTGTYTCSLSVRSGHSERSRTKLIVGAVQTPFLGVSNVTESGVELQCEVRGSSSKPSVRLRTCEGVSLKSSCQTVSDSRGRYDTTCLITVTATETNCFSCVVKQEDVNHRVDSEITLSGELFEKTPHGRVVLVVSWVSGVAIVVLLVVLALVLYLNVRRCRSRATCFSFNRKTQEEEMMKNPVSRYKTSDEGEAGVALEI